MLRLNADRAGGELFVYKLVAKTGRGFVVAVATSPRAAPQPLEEVTIENDRDEGVLHC